MDFCNESNKIVHANYKKFILPNAVLKAVVVGGSVSRGYANKGCDIDILYFDESVSYYKKRFSTIENFKIELHYVPTSIFDLLNSYIQPYMTTSLKIESENIDYSAWGEKKCPNDSKHGSEMGTLLSSWRELKKLLDGAKVYDSGDWYSDVQKKYVLTTNKKKLRSLIDTTLEQDDSAIGNLINVMKLYMMSSNDVYSKVYWTDYYLKNQMRKIQDDIYSTFSPFPKDIDQWFLFTKQRFSILEKKHYENRCDLCKGEILKCNIGRCANDFINDAIRALENGLMIGCLLSLKRANEYMSRLAKIDQLALPDMLPSYNEYWELLEYNLRENQSEIYNTLFAETTPC